MESVFKLVLATAGVSAVTSALAKVQGGFAALAGVVGTVSASLASVKSAIHMGAELEHLHLRTGQTVSDLVQLQSSFKRAGLDGDKLTTSIARLHKAIDTAIVTSSANRTKELAKSFKGLEEEGYGASDAFERLGLSAAQLKNLTARQQFEALGQAFTKIQTPVERSALAMKIFGKAGSELVQLFAKENVFEAPESAMRMAHRLEDNAAAFEKVDRDLGAINSRLKEMWLVAAESLAPALGAVASALKGLNLAPLGAGIGASASLFGPMLAIAAARPLDNFVLGMATNPALANTLRQSVAGALAPMTGMLAKVLPIGLAAAIGAEILVGIFAAYKEAQNQKLDRARTGFDMLRDIEKNAVEVRSDAGLQDVIAQTERAREKITGMLKEEEGSFFQTDASARAIAAYRQQLEQINSFMRLLTGEWGKVRIEQNLAKDNAEVIAEKEKAAAEWLQSNEADRMRENVGKAQALSRDQDDRLGNLRAALAIDDRTLALYRDIRATRKLTNRESQIALVTENSRADIVEKIATLEKDIARRKTDAAQKALEDQLRNIGTERAKLDADYAHTEAEKWTRRRALITDEIALQEKFIDNLNAMRSSSTDRDARATYDNAIRTGIDKLSSLRGQQAQMGPSPDSWVEQSIAGITRLRESWGTVSQSIANTITGTIGSAVDSISSSISGLILQTTTWRDAFWNVASAIGTTLVNSIVQLGVRWVANQILMATAGKAIMAASIAATAPLAMAQSAVWATPATLASIATFGAADAVGINALAGALALGQGLAMMPGFNEGGYTGETGGIVHEREFVFSAPAVRALGRENLERIHRNARSSAPAGGSSAGGGMAGGEGVTVAMYPDRESAIRGLRSRKGRKFLIQQNTDMRADIGIRT